MNINFESYNLFYITANCRSISEAAKKLHVSQPALTRSIKKLEKQLKQHLFYRSKRGISLTEEGKLLYNYIRPAIEQMTIAEEQFSILANSNKESIRIGTSNTIIKFFLIDHLKTFSQRFPEINLSIEVGYKEGLINMIKTGSLDIAFIYTKEEEKNLFDLKVYNLKKLNYSFVGNKKYQHYANKTFSLDDLKNENILLNNINPSFDDYLLRNENFNIYLNLASHSLIYEFISEGFGIGLTVEEFVKEEIKAKKLFKINISETLQPLNLTMITNQYSFPNHATSQLIDLILKNNK